jgi:aspartyl-tRNA(Asn)/glutamyl-tRNA(Gln) amidotransferase subunit C
MSISRQDVHHVALLARLHLGEDEEAEIAEKLGHILEHFEMLVEIDTSGVEPTAHVIPLATPFRDDVASNLPDCERWMANAPARSERYFRVPKIID